MTAPAELLTVDMDAAESCREIIVGLQQAYFKLVSGKGHLKVRHQERWLEYQPGTATQLLALINTIWAQCPDTDGLINLTPGNRVPRGAPFFLKVT